MVLDSYNTNDPKALWETMQPFFVKLGETFTEAQKAAFEGITGIDLAYWTKVDQEVSDKITPNIIPFLAYVFGVDEDTAKEWYTGLDMPWPLNWLMLGITLLTTLGTRAMRSSDVFLEKDIQSLLSQTGHTLPDPQALIRAAFIDSGRTGKVRDSLKKYGYNEENIDNLFIANYQLYDIQTIRTAWLRGVIDDDLVFERMREHGFTDTRIREIMETWPLLPGPQDLFFMVAKEAFEPETYKTLGLDAEFPTEQLEWLQKQGISEGWARKYWIAHWDQPSIQQGFEMLHRGVIGMEEIDILFKTVEIPPYWRDKLTKIAYMPYTRVDVRRMHDMGVLTDEELIRSYMDLGYDEKHALKMAEFTVRYNQGAEKRLSKGEILKGYKKKALSFEDAKDLLMSIDFSADHSEYLLTFEDYLERQDIEDLQIKNLQDRYENNLIDLDFVVQELGKMNLPSERVDLLLEKWQIAKFEDRKMPSKGDLLKFLRNNIITEDEYRQEMNKLGYGWNYVTWFSDLAKSEAKLGPTK